ncbi:MAG: hypothetical protein WC683_03920 [bacterium]
MIALAAVGMALMGFGFVLITMWIVRKRTDTTIEKLIGLATEAIRVGGKDHTEFIALRDELRALLPKEREDGLSGTIGDDP